MRPKPRRAASKAWETNGSTLQENQGCERRLVRRCRKKPGAYRGERTMIICRPSIEGSSSTLATVAVSAFTLVIKR